MPDAQPIKLLLHCSTPFMLAHGGAQIQIEQTYAALQKIGLHVERLEWWNDSQTADVLHFFGRMPIGILRLAQAKGMKVVLADLLTEQGSRSPGRLRSQKMVSRILKRALPGSLVTAFNWDSYKAADACIALTTHEANMMHYLFDTPREKLHVVPNGVEDVFLENRPATRGPWLVCTATITERKRIVELAEAAVAAQTPLWIVGKAYADTDPYAKRYLDLVARHPKILRYEGPIADRARMAQVYREARGFVLLSTMESLSLSALEAAACKAPLLLSDLPWARTVFKDGVSYCSLTDTAPTAAALRRFYDAAPTLPAPPTPLTWVEVAQQLKRVYEGLLTPNK